MKSNWFAVALFFGALLSVEALGAKTFPLTSSPAVPAATGKVEVKKDKNGNNELTIKAEHLAQPGRLTPPSTTYIVWFQEHDGDPASQGELRVGKDLEGEFKATTRLSNFEVLITAEGDPTTKNPSGQVVLRAKVQD